MTKEWCTCTDEFSKDSENLFVMKTFLLIILVRIYKNAKILGRGKNKKLEEKTKRGRGGA